MVSQTTKGHNHRSHRRESSHKRTPIARLALLFNGGRTIEKVMRTGFSNLVKDLTPNITQYERNENFAIIGILPLKYLQYNILVIEVLPRRFQCLNEHMFNDEVFDVDTGVVRPKQRRTGVLRLIVHDLERDLIW